MSIEVKNLSYTYNTGTVFEVNAVNCVDLKINDGEFVGIMGKTGCGKSTFVQLIAGLIEPTEGHIYIDGDDISGKDYDRAALRKKLGIVFQYPEYQLFETSVMRDVAFGIKHHGLSREEKKHRVKTALESMGFSFETIKDKSPLSLSGGEKRRVAIAGVLVTEPDILILDEPVAGLDPMKRDLFMEFVRDLNRQGKTIIMISHNSDYICEYAERVIIFDKGKVACDGTCSSVFSDKEMLHRLGVDPSQSARLAELLRLQGMDISRDIIDYERLVEELADRLKGDKAYEI